MILAATRAVDELAVAALVLAGTSTVFLAVLSVRRVLLARSLRRRLEAEERLRPLALALLDEDEAPPALELPAADAPLFAELLGRYGRTVRGDVTERLRVWFTDSGALDEARASLGAGRGWERAAAAYALGDMGSHEPVPDLIAALDDRDAGVRAAAARSLGRLRAADAVAPLVSAEATGRIPRLVVGQALLSVGPPALPALLERVGAPDAHERAAAVELVGLIGGAVDAAPLAAALDDASAEVREQAARALGRLGADEAAARLRELLDDRIPFVRTAAAEALGEIGDDESAEALRRVALEDAYEPARAAAGALARIAPEIAASGGGPYLDEAADLLAL